MVSNYTFSNQKIIDSTEENPDWIAVHSPTSHEIEKLADRYDIPRDMFVNEYFPENITEIERFHSEQLGECLYLVLISYRANQPHLVEKGLYPITFIFNKEALITISNQKDQLVRPSIQMHLDEGVKPGQLIVSCILNSYHLFIAELNRLKSTIDEISNQACTSTKREILLRLTDTERDRVFLEQTLDDQKETIEELMTREFFQEMVKESVI